MANSSSEVRPRIGEFLPAPDFCATYEIRIYAPNSTVYECLLRSDFNGQWAVRLLMTLRSGKRIPRERTRADVRERLQGAGFVILEQVPEEELVMGVAGRFWGWDGGRHLGLEAEDFVAFSRPGYAQVACNFRLRAESPGSTILSTGTRIQCFGPAATMEVSGVLEFGRPFFRPHTQGDSPAGEDQSGNSH